MGYTLSPSPVAYSHLLFSKKLKKPPKISKIPRIWKFFGSFGSYSGFVDGNSIPKQGFS
jgi:hypothetical protein